MIQPNDNARKILDALEFMTLATADDNGQPWSTPIAPIHLPGDYTYYWISWRDNQHSRNIHTNKKAFLSAFDATPDECGTSDGVYILGEVYEVNDEAEVDSVAAAANIAERALDGSKAFLGTDPRRFYKLVPREIWLSADSDIDGKHIDIRVSAMEEVG